MLTQKYLSGQSKQILCCDWFVKVPDGQGIGTPVPIGQYAPFGHTVPTTKTKSHDKATANSKFTNIKIKQKLRKK